MRGIGLLVTTDAQGGANQTERKDAREVDSPLAAGLRRGTSLYPGGYELSPSVFHLTATAGA